MLLDDLKSTPGTKITKKPKRMSVERKKKETKLGEKPPKRADIELLHYL